MRLTKVARANAPVKTSGFRVQAIRPAATFDARERQSHVEIEQQRDVGSQVSGRETICPNDVLSR